jgi:hypothetical protein
MRDAGWANNAIKSWSDGQYYHIGATEAYRAMLSAAPQPPALDASSVWRMGVEAAAKWHDERGAYASRQVERANAPVEHPFQMAEKIDQVSWSITRRFHENSAAAIRALLPPASLAVAADGGEG